jgi:hypothetical protein
MNPSLLSLLPAAFPLVAVGTILVIARKVRGRPGKPGTKFGQIEIMAIGVFVLAFLATGFFLGGFRSSYQLPALVLAASTISCMIAAWILWRRPAA